VVDIPINEVGLSVTEGGRHGTFIDSLQTAIKTGASIFELSAHMEGPGVGFESYGRSARNALSQIATANKVIIGSVHIPSEIANLSGFVSKGGFSDEARMSQVTEVKKGIDFASSVTDGCAIVIHTGEFTRPISEQSWARDNDGSLLFNSNDEESEKAEVLLIDKSTGKIIHVVKKNQIIPRAEWNKYEGVDRHVDSNGNTVKQGDYIDYEGKKVDRKNRVPKYDRKTGTFVMKDAKWKDFVEEAYEINREFESLNKRKPTGNEVITPEEAFLYASTEAQEKIAKGYSIYYGRQLDKQLERLEVVRKVKEFYDRLEKSLPESEKWTQLRQDPLIGGVVGQLIPPITKMPSELLNETVRDIEEDIKSTQKLVVGQEQTVRQQQITREQTVSVSKYALKQSIKSFVTLGVYAMDATHKRNLKRKIFLAPENIFPEMGYGSHPLELIDLVNEARKAMTDHLVNYRGFSATQAKAEAQSHIRATLDTQHLGMWRKNFVKKSGETKSSADSRFNEWFINQIKILGNSKIIGHIHLVEGFGLGHTHLAPGEGSMPVIEAVTYLKENGYRGFIISEAYGENFFGQGKQATETWKNLDSSIGPKVKKWKDIDKDYFGKGYEPKHLYDDDLWSGVPLE